MHKIRLRAELSRGNKTSGVKGKKVFQATCVFLKIAAGNKN